MNDIEELVKRVIKDDLGDLISSELEARFKPIRVQMDSMQNSQDLISRQLTDDRRDISDTKINVAKIAKAVGVVIENQNSQEDKMVEAVKEEANKISGKVERSVEKMFDSRPFYKKFLARFKKK